MPHSLRAAIGALCFAVLLAGCSRSPKPETLSDSPKEEIATEEPVTVLELPEPGIVFNAPEGWGFSEEPPDEAVGLLQPVSASKDLPALIIQTREIPEDMTLEVAVSSYARFLGPDIEAKEIIVDEAFRLPTHDIPAYEIRYSGVAQNVEVTSSHVIFLSQGNAVVITRMANREQFDELLPVFNQILESLAFSEAPEPDS